MRKHVQSILVVGLLAAASISGACSRVNPGHVGIKVVAGGSDRGVQDFPQQVGWVFYNPLTTSIFEYPTFTQTAVWTASKSEGHPTNEEITFTNRDNMLISADVNIAYHVLPEKVPAFYVKFRNDDIDAFTHGYLRNAARDAFNTHAGTYSIDNIMGDNSAFVGNVKQSLQKEVEPLGVVLDQFGIIGAPRPPQSVIDGINAKVHATQLAIQKQNELVQAQADAQKTIAEADGEAKSILLRAEAQATANRKLADSITPTLVQYRALEKWNGVLPTMTGSNAVPFINVSPKQ